MIFRQLFDSDTATYTYLLACETTREGLLIDPVYECHLRDLALLRELDVKLDAGGPVTGLVRVAVEFGDGAVFGDIGESDALCLDTDQYNVASDVQDCNMVYLY